MNRIGFPFFCSVGTDLDYQTQLLHIHWHQEAVIKHRSQSTKCFFRTVLTTDHTKHTYEELTKINKETCILNLEHHVHFRMAEWKLQVNTAFYIFLFLFVLTWTITSPTR